MPEILKELESAGFMVPNLKNSNFAVFDALRSNKAPGLTGECEGKIIVILDGFGMNLLRKVTYEDKNAAEAAEAAELRVITTIFPSATACVLSSLLSGQLPSTHGLIGDVVPYGDDRLVNTFYLSDIFDSGKKVIGGLGVGDLFPSGGNLAAMMEYGLAAVLPRGTTKYPVMGKMFEGIDASESASLEEALSKAAALAKAGEKRRILVYYAGIDHAEHMHGHFSTESIAEAKNALALLKRLAGEIHGQDYNIVATADHGQLTVKDSDFKVMTPSSKSARLLRRPPWGNPRTLFLEAKEGSEDRLMDAFDKEFGDYGIVFESQKLIDSGLFGETAVASAKRINFGTHVVIEKGSSSINYLQGGILEPWFDRPLGQIGAHGGLSKDEMEVPLIIF